MEHYHFIGIGGFGLSAIARVLHEMGYTVTGSDRAESPLIEDLRKIGLDITIGHHAENIAGSDLVIRSSAIPDDNPEVKAARTAGIPVFKRADFLGELMTDKVGIAIAGTHGKTTTTAMIAWVLSALKQDPTFIVGGVLNNLGVNARAGKGKVFVIEADEYDHMFLGLKPSIAVVTNVEYDHPDCFPTPEDFKKAFDEFVDLLPEKGTLVACAEDAGALALIERIAKMGKHTIAYGIENHLPENMDHLVRAKELKLNDIGGFSFKAIIDRQSLGIDLQVPGQHNVRNALATMSVMKLLEVPLDTVAQVLKKFKGVRRRFEVLEEVNGITIIDDYAHHPTEIRTTLATARLRYPGRSIWVVWQPHTYSRTQKLFDEFTHAFQEADKVIVTEIFAAREARQDFSAKKVVEALQHPEKHFIADLPDVSKYLIANIRPGNVLLVLSAGNADQVSKQVLAHLHESETKNEK